MTELVGILNITPDSFSDGGRFNTAEYALQRCHQLSEDGATVIDIGAESTRPGATTLTEDEEWQRLKDILPVLKTTNITLSLDSYHISTIRKALDYGIDWINYVSSDINSDFTTLAQSYPDTKIVLMHNLGIPANKTITLSNNLPAIEQVNHWFENLLAPLTSEISQNRIILDPGIGFGKTPSQSLNLINNAARIMDHRFPIMVGHSRKSFLELPPNADNELRDHHTSIYSRQLAQQHVDYLRVHNVAINRQTIT